MARRFDRVLDAATDQTLIEPNWELILECIDMIRAGDVPAKAAIGSIQKKYHSDNPHTAHHALLVLEAAVKNCGSRVHNEIATKEFMDDLKNIVIEGAQEKVKAKVLELIQCWSCAFEKYPQYKIVCDTHSFMKMYGYDFPSLREADALFMTNSAPEWVDGDCCFRCRVEFGLLTRKHHCRMCGQIFCDRCSGHQMILPQFGIEKKVRVCESCFLKKTEPQAANDEKKQIIQQDAAAKARADEEARLREEEELQLAIALSQSEAEASSGRRTYPSASEPYYAEVKTSTKRSSSPPPDTASITAVESTIYQGVAKQNDDDDDIDPALAQYLDKKYWEQRQAAREANIIASAPPPSEISLSLSSNGGDYRDVAETPRASIAGTPAPTLNGQNGTYEISQKMAAATLVAAPLPTDDVERTHVFVEELRQRVETMDIRMRSNLLRNRPIVGDSALYAMFKDLTAKHQEVLNRMSELDTERENYEKLQDHLSAITLLREALNSMREDYTRELQERLRAEQQQRQDLLKSRLQRIRQEKYESLITERQLNNQQIYPNPVQHFQPIPTQIHPQPVPAPVVPASTPTMVSDHQQLAASQSNGTPHSVTPENGAHSTTPTIPFSTVPISTPNAPQQYYQQMSVIPNNGFQQQQFPTTPSCASLPAVVNPHPQVSAPVGYATLPATPTMNVAYSDASAAVPMSVMPPIPSNEIPPPSAPPATIDEAPLITFD